MCDNCEKDMSLDQAEDTQNTQVSEPEAVAGTEDATEETPPEETSSEEETSTEEPVA